MNAQIPVCAHIGLTPQSSNMFGGFRVQGKSEEAAKELIEAAQAVEKAGAFMLVLEGIPEKLAAIITKKVHIPTIGIGASAECDGQVLVYQDMLAMYGNFVPKFVKQFAQVGEVMQGAVKDYINAVKEGTFPGPENTYAISDDVIENYIKIKTDNKKDIIYINRFPRIMGRRSFSNENRRNSQRSQRTGKRVEETRTKRRFRANDGISS